MSIDDQQRLRLLQKLEATLGADDAATLMAHLPPVTWQSVATKDDVHASAADVRTELHTEFADVRTELRTGFADVRTELRTGFADLAGQIQAATVTQLRWSLGFFAAWSTIMLALVRLFF